MEVLWTDVMDSRLSKAVIQHKFDFSKVAADLKVSEEEARIRWTILYCRSQGIESPPIAQPQKPKEAVKAIEGPQVIEKPKAKTPDRTDFLDISDVDFSQQTSLSITGETITPSRFNILDHSLKDTCDQIRQRAIQHLPKMDFFLEGEESEDSPTEEIAQFRSRMEGGELILERLDAKSDRWMRTEPVVTLPSMEDIKLIPDDYDPAQPKLKYAAEVQNRPSTMIWNPQVPAISLKEVIYKGTKTLVNAAESSNESEEEDLEVLKKTRQTMRGRVVHDVPKTQITLVEDEPSPPSTIDIDKDTTLTPAYRNIIKKHEESQKEAVKLIKELQHKWKEEKDEELRKKAEERKAKEEALQLEELKLQEASNQKLQAERERKLTVKMEEAKRKEQIAKIREEEEAEAAKQAMMRKFEQKIKEKNQVHLFDRQVSFGVNVPSVESGEGLQVIVAEDCEEAWEILWYFARCSRMFGHVPEDSYYFELTGVLMIAAYSLGDQLEIRESGNSKRYICLGLLKNPTNSRSLSAYVAGFPLNFVISKPSHGKLFLNELFTIIESVRFDETTAPASDLFTRSQSLYVNGQTVEDYKFAAVLIKAQDEIETTIQMTSDLITQAKTRGLDVVGLRTVDISADLQEAVNQAISYNVPAGSSLAIGFYGPRASTVLNEVIGPDNFATARKYKPESIHAKYGSLCAFYSVNSAKAHKDMCYWFGGRVPVLAEVPSVVCYPIESCTIVLGPQFSIAYAVDFVDWLGKQQLQVRDVLRCEISSDASKLLKKEPSRDVQRLGVSAISKACVLIEVSRPNLWRHTSTIAGFLSETGEDFTLLTDNQEEFKAVVDPSPIGVVIPQLPDYPRLSYILLTPEAFKPENSHHPVSLFMTTLMKRVEVVGLKMLKTKAQALEVTKNTDSAEDLTDWITSDMNLLLAIRALDVETEIEKALQACKWQYKSSISFAKPLYITASNPVIFSQQEISADPISLKCPFPYCPVSSLKFNDFSADVSHSVAVIKPERNFIMLKQFLRVISKRGFDIAYAEGKQLSHKQIDLLYANSQEVAKLTGNELDFDQFRENLYGSSVVFLVKHLNSVQKLLEIAGDPDPSKASSVSLRGAYGTSLEDNGLHCSASLYHAEIEAASLCKTEDYGLLNSEDPELSNETTCIAGQLTTAQLSAFLEEMLHEGFKLLNLKIDTFSPVQLSIYNEVSQKDASLLALMSNKPSVVFAFRCSATQSASNVIQHLGLQSNLNASRGSRESLQEIAIFFNELLN